MRSVRLVTGLLLAVSLAAIAPAQAVARDRDSESSSDKSGNAKSEDKKSDKAEFKKDKSDDKEKSGKEKSENEKSGDDDADKGGAEDSDTASEGHSGVVIITPPACGLSDISVGALACSGFFAGNLLNNSPSGLAAQADTLDDLGLIAWDGDIAEPQLNLSSSLVNFSTGLYGLTYVGIHFGAGAGSPSPHTPGGVTGFYRFDAGTNLDTFTLAFGSASGARLYSTQAAPAPELLPPVRTPESPFSVDIPGAFEPSEESGVGGAVPEPATWLMLILGFGGIGSVLRARRKSLAAETP